MVRYACMKKDENTTVRGEVEINKFPLTQILSKDRFVACYSGMGKILWGRISLYLPGYCTPSLQPIHNRDTSLLKIDTY